MPTQCRSVERSSLGIHLEQNILHEGRNLVQKTKNNISYRHGLQTLQLTDHQVESDQEWRRWIRWQGQEERGEGRGGLLWRGNREHVWTKLSEYSAFQGIPLCELSPPGTSGLNCAPEVQGVWLLFNYRCVETLQADCGDLGLLGCCSVSSGLPMSFVSFPVCIFIWDLQQTAMRDARGQLLNS